jgi:predicted alpha/beta superfamily hydrolase
MNRFVIETFEIDRVRAIDRDFACIDIAAHRTDESEVFVLIITAERGGKQNQREAAVVAESEHFKLAAQVRRPPFDIAFVHKSGATILVATRQNRKPEACVTFHFQRSVSFSMPKHTLTGTIKRHRAFPSKILGNRRDVLVYLPPGYRRFSRKDYPVLYLHDGQNVFDAATAFGGVEWGVDETAERLIRNKLIEPLIIVAVANIGEERIHEYAPTPGVIEPKDHPRKRSRGLARIYGQFLIEELKPFIDKKYRTKRDPEFTGLGGSSLGGLATLAMGILYSEVFTRLIVMSPSIWWDDYAIFRLVGILGEKPPLKIWLDTGTDEPSWELARDLRDYLIDKGWQLDVDLGYLEVKGADHSEAAWAARVEPALRFLFRQRNNIVTFPPAEPVED